MFILAKASFLTDLRILIVEFCEFFGFNWPWDIFIK